MERDLKNPCILDLIMTFPDIFGSKEKPWAKT